jgi:serine O-acetyltransferase
LPTRSRSIRQTPVVRLWLFSIWLHKRGATAVAKAVKALIFLFFHAQLPYQASVHPSVMLGHHGMGVVIHPATIIGRKVLVWHGVTIAAQTENNSGGCVVIEDDVELGAGSIVIARSGAGLRIGRGASIGAGSVVTRDVPPGATVTGPAAAAVRGRE